MFRWEDRERKVEELSNAPKPPMTNKVGILLCPSVMVSRGHNESV